MSGFTKLFSSLVYSTVWREDMHVKVVWITMLALADRNGRVLASLPGLADAARVSLEQCQDALHRLSCPDQWSRTKDFEGKRIQECDGGWQLLNYLKYRELRDADERRIQTRESVRQHRARASKQSKQSKPRKAQAEAEADTYTEEDQERSSALTSSAKPVAVLTFPTVGAGGMQRWPLTDAQLAEWVSLYPGVNVLSEAQKALAWIQANPTRRKTFGGMPKFLVNWLNRATNNRGSGAFQAPTGKGHQSVDAMQAALVKRHGGNS